MSDRVTYSMRVVTRLTGLSADTIRKWEQRYGAVHPLRSQGNTRKFTQDDVKRLGLLSELTHKGHAIGDVAPLPTEELEALLGKDGAEAAPASAVDLGSEQVLESLRERYLDAVRRYEVREAATLLSRAASALNPSDFATGMVLPLLRRTGSLWSHEQVSVGQEHLVSSQLRALLITMLQWTAPLAGARKILLTTPEGHLHEFGVLVGALLAAHRGLEPIYLGPHLPADDISDAARETKADVVLLSVVRDVDAEERRSLLALLARLSKKTKVWLGLPADHPLVDDLADSDVRLFSEFESLDLALTRLATSGRA